MNPKMTELEADKNKSVNIFNFINIVNTVRIVNIVNIVKMQKPSAHQLFDTIVTLDHLHSIKGDEYFTSNIGCW